MDPFVWIGGAGADRGAIGNLQLYFDRLLLITKCLCTDALGVGCLFWIAAAAIVVMYPRSREQIGGKQMKLWLWTTGPDSRLCCVTVFTAS